MRPKKPKVTEEGDLFRARLDQIINMKHELVQLAAKLDWDWIDGQIAPLYSDKGRPGIETRFVIAAQAHLRPVGRRRMRTLGPRSLFPALHRRDVFPARIPARALRPEPLAQAPR